jgi:1,4-alpha-glucan branching enzyme
MKHDLLAKVNPFARRLLEARLHDPRAILGPRAEGSLMVVRAFDPYADAMCIETADGWEPMDRIIDQGLFEWRSMALPSRYRLKSESPTGARIGYDPYAFAPTLSEHDLYLFNKGRLHQAHQALGAHAVELDGVAGFRFAVWAPSA